MSYVVLARRFRPQTLDQIIGQEHISRTLKNAIAENRVAHAYLFSGPRGVGKTTTARILAKALNCKNTLSDEPCGKCSNCIEITLGNNIDVQEIDGASNRGIDEIRALRDNVKFAPASSKYKIYIIDEAHQITDAAFNALLKTLEEPPSHVVFILATTEPQKIPVTILSRCQRYRFRLISSDEIMKTLGNIVKSEKFNVEPAALQIITGASGGSMRDALSLLDQAMAAMSGAVTAADVQNLLGFLPREILISITEAVSREDMAAILGIVKDVTEQGFNLLQFVRDIRENFRRLLLMKVSPDILEVSDNDIASLKKQQELFTSAWLIRSGHILSRALDEMRWSDQPRLVLELYLLKLAQPYAAVNELIERIDKMEKGIPSAPAAPRAAAPVRTVVPPAAPKPAVRPAPEYKPSAAPAAPEVREPQPQPMAVPVPVEEPSSEPVVHSGGEVDFAAVWRETVKEFQGSRPIVGSFLTKTVMKGMNGTVMMVAVANKFEQEGIKRSQPAIEESIQKRTGKEITLRLSIDTAMPSAPEKLDSVAAESAPAEEIVVQEEMDMPQEQEFFQVDGDLSDTKNSVPPGLEKIVNKFPGKVTKKK